MEVGCPWYWALVCIKLSGRLISSSYDSIRAGWVSFLLRILINKCNRCCFLLCWSGGRPSFAMASLIPDCLFTLYGLYYQYTCRPVYMVLVVGVSPVLALWDTVSSLWPFRSWMVRVRKLLWYWVLLVRKVIGIPCLWPRCRCFCRLVHYLIVWLEQWRVQECASKVSTASLSVFCVAKWVLAWSLHLLHHTSLWYYLEIILLDLEVVLCLIYHSYCLGLKQLLHALDRKAEGLVGKPFIISRCPVQCSLDYTELLIFSHEFSVNMSSELHIWLKILYLFYNL